MNFTKNFVKGAMALSLATTLCKADEKAKINIVPRPESVTVNQGTGVSLANIAIQADTAIKDEASYLLSELKNRYKINATIAKSGNIKLVLDQNSGTGSEGYTIETVDKKVVISAATKKGVFYGIQSFLQLVPTNNQGSFTVPNLKIVDSPRFSWRASHLDVCRHFYPISFVKRYIDFLAMHKFNKFHWHLTEDQGWRVQIDKYPRLTEVGAWRKINNIMDYQSKVIPETAEEIKARLIAQGSYKVVDGQAFYGGFYTKEQLKQVVEYAKSRHIEVIPEIEMPGHTQAVMAAYPHLACEGAPESFDVWTRFGVSRNVFCAGKEETFTFLENVLDEVFEVFPSKIIHIGGDECPKANWKECIDCQVRIKSNNLHNEHELQSYFIKRMQKYINSKGRKIVGWSEILEGGLAKGATVMSWLGTGAGIQAAKLGNDAIMTPFGQTYYNMKEDPTGQGPGHSSSYLPIKNVYGFEPVPADLDSAIAKRIIGYQPCLWTEYVPTTKDVEFLTFPRLAASAEVAWTSRENRDFEDFSDRLKSHYAHLDTMGIHYFVNPPTLPGKRVVLTDEKPVKISTDFPGGVIRYTMDGSEPTENSPVYTKPLNITEKTTLRAKTFAPNGLASSINQTVFELTGLNQVDKAGINSGLAYTLYKIKEAKPSLENAQFIRKGNCGGFTMPTGVGGDMFAIKLEGIIEIKESANYTIYALADDSIKISIGGALVINNTQANKEETGTIQLEKGFYTIEAEFFEYGGAERFSVAMSKDDSRDKRPVTAEMLSFNGEVHEMAYSTTMRTHDNHNLSLAFDGDEQTFFWTPAGPRENDNILITVPSNQTVSKISVKTGVVGHEGDKLEHGVIEISGDGLSFEPVAAFNDGKANVNFGSPKNLKFIRIRATRGQGNWLTVSEITID